MQVRSLDHLSTPALRRELAAIVVRDRRTTAEMLEYLAEFDARKVYVEDGYASMFTYCVHELHFSEDVAYKRIRAARAARRFPAIHAAVADGRLHLSAIVVLAPHLTPANAGELLIAATHQTKTRVEQLVAERFPRPDLPVRIQALAPPTQLAPGPVGACAAGNGDPGPLPAESGLELAPGPVVPVPRTKIMATAPQRFALQVTLAQATHDKLRRAQALLAHRIPPGDVAAVLDRALDALIQELEKRKYAATDRPRAQARHASANPRHIPNAVQRAVQERDQGQCTFVSDSGRRCCERAGLEFDHIEPVARGGGSNLENLRLRCRAHNQLEAERAFGPAFMHEKRDAARVAVTVKRAMRERDAARHQSAQGAFGSACPPASASPASMP